MMRTPPPGMLASRQRRFCGEGKTVEQLVFEFIREQGGDWRVRLEEREEARAVARMAEAIVAVFQGERGKSDERSER